MKSIKYEHKTKTLTVVYDEFRTFVYKDVPAYIWRDFVGRRNVENEAFDAEIWLNSKVVGKFKQ